MKITARLTGENPTLVSELQAQGINAKLVKGGIIVELPEDERSTYQNTIYRIPEQVKDAMPLLDCSEYGGGMTNTGDGTVVCGLSGKALRPYYVPRSGHLANGTHAYFSVPAGAITVTGHRRDRNIEIKEYTVLQDNGVAWIETRRVWNGEIESLPETYQRYRAAAEAAYTKANCYHCREPHFIAE